MDTVLVTGFGPFGGHKVNASWEVVKQLAFLGLKESRVNLQIEELPVSYETISTMVPALWETHKPILVVHVGVSSIAKDLTIETEAHLYGYQKDDIDGTTPKNGCCTAKGDACITTNLDVEKVCSQVSETVKDITIIPSCDAGRYLCEYTFYTSLTIDRDRTIFVHVPMISKQFTVPIMAHGLQQIIFKLIDQIRAKEKNGGTESVLNNSSPSSTGILMSKGLMSPKVEESSKDQRRAN